MKKQVLVVIIILTLASAALAREGAQLILQNRDGTKVAGELLAVKHYRLILKQSDTDAGVTADIRDLAAIMIMGKSSSLPRVAGGVGGFLVGGGAGYLVVRLTFRKSYELSEAKSFWKDVNIGLLLVLGCATVGAVIGANLVGSAGADTTIQVEGKPDVEIQKILERLRSKALLKGESY